MLSNYSFCKISVTGTCIFNTHLMYLLYYQPFTYSYLRKTCKHRFHFLKMLGTLHSVFLILPPCPGTGTVWEWSNIMVWEALHAV